MRLESQKENEQILHFYFGFHCKNKISSLTKERHGKEKAKPVPINNISQFTNFKTTKYPDTTYKKAQLQRSVLIQIFEQKNSLKKCSKSNTRVNYNQSGNQSSTNIQIGFKKTASKQNKTKQNHSYVRKHRVIKLNHIKKKCLVSKTRQQSITTKYMSKIKAELF